MHLILFLIAFLLLSPEILHAQVSRGDNLRSEEEILVAKLAETHYTLALLYGLEEKWVEALPHLLRAVRLSPENETYKTELTRVLRKLGTKDGAPSGRNADCNFYEQLPLDVNSNQGGGHP
jgi:tetratricopeptide (TPR) repeat protein